MDKNEMTKKIWGVLAGCALGDAMGMPTEMMSRKDINSEFPEGVTDFSTTTDKDAFGRSMQAGEITDDTVNTLLLVQMLIDSEGKINTNLYLDYLQNWMKENPEKCRYVAGPSTLRALDAIKNGVPLERAGIFGTTNGAAMKISPIGIISDYHNMEKLVDNVEQICMPTHNTSTAIAGASVVAACVSFGVRGGSNPSDLWEIAIKAAELGSDRGYAFPTASLIKRIEAVRKLVESGNREQILEELKTFYGTSVETVESIPAVLAVVQLAKGDAWKAACMSASLGGDTDTIGAISGAICGGMRPVFPDGVVETLERVNEVNFEELAEKLSAYVQA